MVLREIVKHNIESVTLCEIDPLVIELSKKYLKTHQDAFNHPKVKVVVEDGFKFLSDKVSEYDVVITDSSDPVGPAEVLFQKEFYTLIHKALKPDGIFCNQGECPWLHLDLIKKVLKASRELYPTVAYAVASVPTYPSGQIGFIVCSKTERDLTRPVRRLTREEEDTLFRYYTADLHSAAFVLPNFARKAVEEATL